MIKTKKEIMSEDLDKFGLPVEENCLMEMANIQKSTSGLNVVFWAGPKPMNTRKGIRIKVSRTYSNRFDPDDTFSIYFDGDEQKIEGDIGEIKSKDIENIKNLFRDLRSIFLQFWNKEIGDDQFKRVIAKYAKKKFEKIGVEESCLMEMANAIQAYTGLPGVVYFCTKEEMKNSQAHSLGRVKWINAGEQVSVTIKTKGGKRLYQGSDRQMIKKLIRFVKENEDLLWEYWNTPMDEADSSETMKKFVKV